MTLRHVHESRICCLAGYTSKKHNYLAQAGGGIRKS
jgi:hypothetical protein